MPRCLTTAANDNYLSTFVSMTKQIEPGTVRRFGPITATATGIPIASYNRVFVTDTPTEAEFAAALAWMRERGDPFWVTTTDATVAEVRASAADHDVVEHDSQPGMVHDSLADLPPTASDVDTSVVVDATGLDDFVDVFAAVFAVPRELATLAHPEAFLADDRLDLVVGSVDDRPVACGLLFRSDDAAGVYSIGVVEGYRRRGIGRAMTLAVLRLGRDAGCRIGVLQSSEMGYPLYEGMGFEPVETYHHFEPVTQRA